MEFPFGHGHHHHNRRDDDNDGGEDERQRFPPHVQHNVEPGYDGPPPSQYGDNNPYGPPTYPSPVQHVSHQSGYGYDPPPPQEFPESGEYGHHRRPVSAAGHDANRPVQHVSHQSGYGYDPPPPQEFPESGEYGHHRRPVSAAGHDANRQPTVRVFTMANEDYSLSISDGKVVLAPANPRDDYQHWIKDMKYSTRVKDEESLPSFALVNKVTGEAIKHSTGATHPVRLVPYNPDYLDESVLWTESYDTGEGFRCIRMVNNIRLNFDAFNGDEDHGGVHDGTPIVLWEWAKGKNQRWKIVPY